jgi:NAD(P)-dependent dehydrogenase (short-subunit alcohol dehydrogenase family)
MKNGSKNWLITGACSGIGAAVTQMARARGDTVTALDIDATRGEEIAASTGASFMTCDVSQPEDWQKVVQALDAPVDFLHLNAGIQIAPPSAPMEDYQFSAMKHDRYRRMMGVNVDGVVYGLEALLPTLEAGASIVVTASLAGVVPYAVDPLYSMSKHAVVGLVRSLAPTLAKRDITINALCPGGIDTAIIPQAQRSDEAVFMTPESIAEEVLFLMETEENGKSWAKVAENKPVFIIRAPGDKSQA